MKKDILNLREALSFEGTTYSYASLARLAEKYPSVLRLPYSIRILLENVLHYFDDFAVTRAHIDAIVNWKATQGRVTVPFSPSRVLMQDFTGVPAVVDLASIRSEVARKGGVAEDIHPLVPVDIVIDHSVQVEFFGDRMAYARNVEREYARNRERYQLLKWAQQAFRNFRVVPPGMGICHQVNLEYLAQGLFEQDGYLFPDTLVGTDSHTPMVNALGVLGWGVGGIEAEAAILGQPLYMGLPEVLGLRLSGELPEGSTATDLVLHLTYLLREKGVVGKFVEVFGDGVSALGVPDRATISNMSPEFGCTDTHWPVDEMTLNYFRKTGRVREADLLERYAKENLLWREEQSEIEYSDTLEVDLSEIESTISGPKRPQDKVLLSNAKQRVIDLLEEDYSRSYRSIDERRNGAGAHELRSTSVRQGEGDYLLSDAGIVIAAITSCTNTSNPSVMVGAGLLAKRAVERGLSAQPWVKTSLAPGSRVVTSYLKQSGLLPYLEELGFYVVGYGCTTCIGNSGEMPAPIQKAVEEHDLIVAAVLSGNRNFEARIHPQVRMNFLASPMLVVAYAIAGRMDFDMNNEPLGKDKEGNLVYLRDIWPRQREIAETLEDALSDEDFTHSYAGIFEGDDTWRALEAPSGTLYQWSDASTYIKEAPFFKSMTDTPAPTSEIQSARVLLLLGDMVTTDHISPAGKFSTTQPAGIYLDAQGISSNDFNSYGARRGNHEIMMRGTFANVRIRNKLVEKEGGYTKHMPSGRAMSIFDAAEQYAQEGTPLIVIGGKEYGSGSSRDWAAKGTSLLGVKAVIAESFERIHRSNLVGMGVLPIEFIETSSSKLRLQGNETFSIKGLNALTPNKVVDVEIRRAAGFRESFKGRLRLDSEVDILYYQHGGILQYVLRTELSKGSRR